MEPSPNSKEKFFANNMVSFWFSSSIRILAKLRLALGNFLKNEKETFSSLIFNLALR